MENIQTLIEIISKNDYKTGEEAILKLISIGKDVLPFLMLNYKKSTNRVKHAFILIFGELKAIETIELLKEVINSNGEDTYLKIYALESLGKIGTIEAFDILADKIRINELITGAAKGLALYKDKRAENVLIEALKSINLVNVLDYAHLFWVCTALYNINCNNVLIIDALNVICLKSFSFKAFPAWSDFKIEAIKILNEKKLIDNEVLIKILNDPTSSNELILFISEILINKHYVTQDLLTMLSSISQNPINTVRAVELLERARKTMNDK